jgi:TPP-dependent trihydroxycyclohexane-1,2-dione (THcHDO) dehydratase
VLYSEAAEGLRAFAERHGVPVMETNAGKSSLPHDHPLNMGSVGVTGSSASNLLAEQADLVLAVGSRLQDFTTGSWALFKADNVKIIGLNTQVFDAYKHRGHAAHRRRQSRARPARWQARTLARPAMRGTATAKTAKSKTGWFRPRR